MRFKLQDNVTQSSIVVQLNEQMRMPLQSYASAAACLILDDVAMSNMNWKIVLDEAFRSINSTGIIDFNFSEFKRYDLRRMWQFLGRSTYNRKCELVEYARIQGNQHRVKIKITRIPKAQNSWSICYVTDGRNIAQINATAELIEGNENIEILVSGPKDRMPGLHGKIQVLDDQNLPREAMISLKKNLMIKQAKNENLLLIHDRYQISEEFFLKIDEYGYDFDVLVPKQMYQNTNVEFPGFLAEENNRLLAVTQNVIRDEFTVNGGCIIIKRDLAIATPLNSFLAWQEAEDFDWSLRLIQNGLIPRPVRDAVVFTVGTDLAKTAKIMPINFQPSDIDFLTEIDCLSVNQPVTFFSELPTLLESYSIRAKYAKKSVSKSFQYAESWNSKARFHLTPLRYCFALTLRLSLRIGRNPLKIPRAETLRAFFRYSKELVGQSGKAFFLVGPVSIWIFFTKR